MNASQLKEIVIFVVSLAMLIFSLLKIVADYRSDQKKGNS